MVAPVSFFTIQHPAEALLREQGSKFLAFAYPVSSEAEIKEHLAALRKKYFDATHHCYAWMLGAEKKLFRAQDDGEPNHSAGTPILGQLRAHDVTDVLVVVVRYFGGTKLGVGGLTQAYKTAADMALRATQRIEVEIQATLTVDYDYTASPLVQKTIKDFDLKIVEERYGEKASITVHVKLRRLTSLTEHLDLQIACHQPIQYQLVS